MNSNRFPRSKKYNPEWVQSGASSAANPLILTEWLTQSMNIESGMRILDLGCGRAISSIFLAQEFDVQVWAVDLWFDPQENHQRISHVGMEQKIFPFRGDARMLPFPCQYFDVVISIDAYPYFGTDDMFLFNLARHIKEGGQLGIAGAGLKKEFNGRIPEHLKDWWEPQLGCLHTFHWWKKHWQKSTLVNVTESTSLDGSSELWIEWINQIAPENKLELEAVANDKEEFLTYTKTIGTIQNSSQLPETTPKIPSHFEAHQMLL